MHLYDHGHSGSYGRFLENSSTSWFKITKNVVTKSVWGKNEI